MKEYTPFEYLLIDCANHFGLDKSLFEDRIKWVKTQIALSNLDKIDPSEADEPEQFTKAVQTIQNVINGQPSGHIVRLDAICSGIQIMSALTGCIEGAAITGLIDPDKRPDAYTEIHSTFNELAMADGHTELLISRNDTKQAIMTAGYASKRTPERIYGNMIEYFDKATHQRAPGAFQLTDVLVASWNQGALNHSWTMPDGYVVYIPVMDTFEKKAEIDEMNHYEMTVQFKDNVGLDFGLANAA